MAIGSPDVILSALRASEIYSVPLTSLVQVEEQKEQETDEGINSSNPLVKDAIEAAVPAERKQEIVESIVSGTYAWLDGDATSPDFTIDFQEDIDRFTVVLSDAAINRVEQLPDCTFQELAALDSEPNPLTIECRPPIDLDEQKQAFLASLQNDNDLFGGDTVFDGDKLLHEVERRDSTEVVASAPTGFNMFKLSPWIFAAVAVVCGLGVLLLADTRTKGIRRVGILLIETSISLLITGVALYFVIQGLSATISTQSNQEISQALVEVISALQFKVASVGIGALVAYAVVGFMCLLVVRRRNSREKQGVNEELKTQPIKGSDNT